jgi:hypothetical protein
VQKLECLHLNTICTILTPSITFKKQPFEEIIEKKLSLTLAQKMVEQQVRDGILKGSTNGMCERNEKAYYKNNTRIIIEHPHSLQ